MTAKATKRGKGADFPMEASTTPKERRKWKQKPPRACRCCGFQGPWAIRNGKCTNCRRAGKKAPRTEHPYGCISKETKKRYGIGG